MLVKSPSFTFVAVLTLALGIGANAAIFSFINGLLLRPIAGVQQPGRVVGVYTSDYSSGRYGGSSYPDYLDIRQQADLLADAAAYDTATLNLSGPDKIERIRATLVTTNYFQVLGVGAQIGRTLRAEDDVDGSAPTCVLGYGFWQKRFGGDASIIGRSLTLNNKPYTVVGVIASAFRGLRLGQQPEIYLRMDSSGEGRGNRGIGITARLRDGASIDQAQTQLTLIADRLARAYPETNMGIAGRPDSPRPMSVVQEERIGPQGKGAMQGLSTLLFVVVGLVLLIACANVANLLLARASSRRREIAIRLALGASRWQIVRQLLFESILLAIVGGAAGLMISLWTADLIPRVFMENNASALDLSLDWRLLTFTLTVSILTGLIFGLAPAIQTTRPGLLTSLKEERVGSSMRPTRFGLRGTLVTAQVAISCLLLICAGLFLRSLRNAMTFDPGFENRNLLFASLATEDTKLTNQQVQEFRQELVDNLSIAPGVRSVSLTAIVPVSGGGQRRGLFIEGYVPGLTEESEINTNVVGLKYFETMGIPVVKGRDFNSGDRGSPGAVIVNEEFAQRYFPGQDVVGKRVKADSRGPYVDIVGVVRTAKYRNLREAPLPFIYIPLAQEPQSRMSLVVRTEGDPSALRNSVLATVRRLNPNVPVYGVKTITEQIETALSPDRLMAALLAIFGGVALLLASIGIYGVVSYAVSRRTREIGIRMALGATNTNVVGLVLREGMVMASAGVTIGLIAAWALTRLVDSLLFGITATDITTFALITAALLLIALIACYIPAWRATKVNPLRALRHE